MTDQVQNAQPENGEANKVEEQRSEKLLTQSHVDEIVKAKMAAAHDAGRRAAMAELQLAQQNQPPMQQSPMQPQMQQPAQQQQEAQQPQVNSQGANQPSMGNMGQMYSQADVQRIIQQELSQELARQAQVNQWETTKNNFLAKVSPEVQRDPDFVRNVVGPLDLDRNHHLVTLTSMVDNTPDVLRDLRANPEKIAQLSELSRTNPMLAIEKMHALSNSIKNNQAASAQSMPSEPLSQLKPTPVSSDSGSSTIKDLRAKSYLRG